ncbi:hypothetical protein BH09GEM1_BH09GEM1_22490 [soil metagenome]
MKKQSLSAILRAARTLAGQSQRELARVAGTSQSVVGRIEAGLVSPSVETLESLVEAAGFELRTQLVPIRHADPVVARYKRDVDRTLLRENLRRTVEERLRMHAGLREQGEALRKGMAKAQRRDNA